MFARNFIKWLTLLCFIMLLLAFTACSLFKQMTPAQKYGTVRTAFNDLVKSYIVQAKMQPEDIRKKLRENVNPKIKDAEEALDKYYESLTLPDDDADARLAFYLDLKNEILELCLKYGLNVDDKGGAK